jgi:hypothetical protein
MAKRSKLKLEVDSLFDSMHEAYKDCESQKISLLTQLTAIEKLKTQATDLEDSLNIERVLNDSKKILNEVIDKRIKLLQIHSKVLVGFQAAKEEAEDSDVKAETRKLSSEEIKNLRASVLEEAKKQNTYDLR